MEDPIVSARADCHPVFVSLWVSLCADTRFLTPLGEQRPGKNQDSCWWPFSCHPHLLFASGALRYQLYSLFQVQFAVFLVSGVKILSDFGKRRFSCGFVCVYLIPSRNEVVGSHLGLNRTWSPLLGSHNAAAETWWSVWGLLNQGVNWVNPTTKLGKLGPPRCLGRFTA